VDANRRGGTATVVATPSYFLADIVGIFRGEKVTLGVISYSAEVIQKKYFARGYHSLASDHSVESLLRHQVFSLHLFGSPQAPFD
jgi:hypothetical protein